ncbi:MAG: acyl-CoA dehydrogenase [Gammaproteobacteria bacterium]
MSPMFWLALTLITVLTLAYLRRPMWQFTVGVAAVLALYQLSNGGVSLLPWLFGFLILAPLTVRRWRRALISERIYKWYKSVLPAMSETEKTAIEAGTVWWEKDLFSGAPDWNKMLAIPKPTLNAEEQAFLDGPVEELCSMLDDWQISQDNDLPPEVWQFMKDQRFFGMIIPKKYGGLDFSARAQTEVVMKISTRSGAAAVTVMVPNSLGPGELLMHYGTKAQQEHYLPRLARGEEIPAFGLTGPHAGSDAGGMPDAGIVVEREIDGKKQLGFVVNWEKRYITLGPVATVLGLAFKAYDPDGLLGNTEDLGITCALIPTDTAGVSIGNRHYTGAAFQNGPNRGHDVFVPMDWVIGGQRNVGKGWMMLMDSLAVGRSISLPALGTAAGKLGSLLTGAYSRVRRQFKIPIGKFEGVEEALTRIAGITYRMDASRIMTAGALDLGEKPSVISAILKYHNTEGMRTVINDAMDIHGGRGICNGPSNYLNATYRAVPIAITVEGANILTRSMIIFGQGAIRCHPHVLNEMLAVQNEDTKQGLIDFDREFFGHIGFTISNAVRSVVLGLTGSRIVRAPDTGPTEKYFRQLTRMCSAFAFVADITMLMLGGRLKRKEKISGRLGDVLSHLYMASAILKKHEDDGRPSADLPLVRWGLQDSLYRSQEALIGVLRNFTVRPVGWLILRLIFPLGYPQKAPNDRLGQSAAKLLLSPSATRERLTAGVYLPRDVEDHIGMMEIALEKVIAAEPLERKVYGGLKKRVRPYNFDEILPDAVASGVITDIEAQAIREAHVLINKVIRVDEFAPQLAGEATEPVAEAAG